jgi:hypothetical protein
MTADPTVEQLRADIDSGRTGDKVPSHDPAATPLGTDDEAGGTSLSPEVIAQAPRCRDLPATPSAAAFRTRLCMDPGCLYCVVWGRSDSLGLDFALMAPREIIAVGKRTCSSGMLEWSR